MKHLSTAAVLAAALAVAGAASAQGADPYAALYSNTVKQTRADGSGSTIQFNADKTFMMMAGDRHVTGTWQPNDKGDICILMTPDQDPNAHCAAIPTAIGQVTDHTGGNGQAEKFELVAGR